MHFVKVPRPKPHDLVLFTILISTTLYLQASYSSLPAILIQIALITKSILFTKNATLSAKETVTCLLISPEPALFLVFWIYILNKIIKKQSTANTLANKLIGGLLIFSAGLFLYNLLTERLLLNYLFWLSTFFSAFAIYFHGQAIAARVNTSDLLLYIGYCIAVQIFVLIFQASLNGSVTPGDWAKGTLNDAHKLGIILITCTVFFSLRFMSSRQPKSLLIILITLFCFYLCDAKAILLSAVISAPIYLLLLSFLNKKTGRYFLFTHPLPLLIVVLIIYTGAFFLADLSNSANSFEIYLTDDLVSSKYIFFNRVWVDIFNDSPLNWLIGTGPGTLGSRASNILSSDVLYKLNDTTLESLSSSSAWTQVYMRGLWTRELAENIGYYSAILSYPFSGISSIKAELGLIGLLTYLTILTTISLDLIRKINFKDYSTMNTLKITLSLTIFIYMLSMLFDNFQEQPSVAYLLFFVCAIISPSSRISTNTSRVQRTTC